MLIALPLLSALSAMPAIANSYSGTERRTLQSAISSVLYSNEISRFYQRCKEQPAAAETVLTLTDKEKPRLLALLQQKVYSQDVDKLFASEPKLTQLAKSSIKAPTDCADSKGLQTLLDSYEVALFSLEIALPLEKGISNKTTAAKSQTNAESQDAHQLIARSHAIALVNIADKQQLNAIQQANYFHPDYNGRYVFKVQHGWRSNVPQYLGMHLFVSDTDISKLAKQWLIFLDKNGHFIKAIEAHKAPAHLKALQDAEWRYDVHGNLHRN